MAYRVEGFNGIAFHLIGNEKVRDEDYEWSGIEYDNPDKVIVVMIGDDREWIVDKEDVTEIPDEDYCSECGQIGCTADGR